MRTIYVFISGFDAFMLTEKMTRLYVMEDGQ